ncbi:MAG: hypothetical protein IJE08_11310, partial [Clostridia bacterium]|nr:hypothetical protein [Clostridia bacterium]
MIGENAGRIESLRNAAVAPFIFYDEFYLNFYRRYSRNSGLGLRERRYADAYAHAMSMVTPVIDDGELIVGKCSVQLTADENAEWKRLRETVAEPMTIRAGQDSHMAIDYELLLKEGVCGVVGRIEKKLVVENDEGKRIFYETCVKCLRATVVYANRYADTAEKQAEVCHDTGRAEELRKIAEICRRVPEFPAETFYEAVQSVHFMSLCLSMDPLRYFSMQQFQLGHPDKYLYPFYRADKEAGRLTDEEAQVLIDCLAIQINNRVPHGLSSGYMVGGRDRSGNIVANELTFMGMQAVDEIRLVYPAVGL